MRHDELHDDEFDNWLDEEQPEGVTISGEFIGSASRVLREVSPYSYRIQCGDFHSRECEDGKHVPGDEDPNACEWCSEWIGCPEGPDCEECNP